MDEKSTNQKRIISYKPLFRLLVDRDMSLTDLREAAGISASTQTVLKKHGVVTLETILRICNALDCSIEKVVEIERQI